MEAPDYPPPHSFHNDNPPGPVTQEEDFWTTYYCSEKCGRQVDEDGQWCDHCLVQNAMDCWDWDQESIDAARRLEAQIPAHHNTEA